MFTGWKGKKPGSHDHHYPSGTISGPSGGTIGPSGVTPGFPPPSSAVNNVFGAPINPASEGPPLLGKFVRFLQTKAVNTENLFATNSELDAEVQVVKKNILRDMATNPTANDDALQLSSYTKNPQVVAELLRLFLAALPEPLLTFQLYDSFLLTQTIQSPADRVWAYRFLLAYLPPGFRSSVKLLLTFLFTLSRNSEVKGMDAHALATIFGPFFLRAEEELYYMKDDPPLVVQIVALLIQEYESVLRAAPTVGTVNSMRSLNPTVHPMVSSFPASPTPFTPKIQATLPQPIHPLDQSAPQPASLYEPSTTGPPPRPARKASTSKPVPGPSHLAPSNPPPPVQRPPSPIHPPAPAPTPAPPVPTPAPLTPAPTPALTLQTPVQTISSTPTTPTHSPGMQRNSRKKEQEGEEPETLTKLRKLRDSVLVLLNDQISTSIMSLLSAIMASTSAGDAIEVSKALVVVKKFLSEQVQASLKLDKQAISTYLSAHPRPPLSIPPPTATDDVQLNKLKNAAYQATDQFMEIIFYLSTKMSNMTQPEDLIEAVAIAQVAKLLKANTAEQLQKLQYPPLTSTPLSTPLSPSAPFSPTSPPASPTPTAHFPTSPTNFSTPPSTAALRQTLTQNRALNTSSGSLPIVHQLALSPPSRESCVATIDKEISATKQSLEGMLSVLPSCNQNDLVEYAKGIRFTKQLVNEKVSEFALGIDPDSRVEALEGEDQISALRRALTCSVNKIIEQIDALSAHVHSPGGQQMDPRPLAESMSVVSRAMANTYSPSPSPSS